MNLPGITPSPSFYNNPYQPRVNNSNQITWVQGIEGAKAYQLIPNSNVVLLDSESDKFYIKSSDNVGMCTLRTFSYTEEFEHPKEQYVTKSELEATLNAWREQYEQLISTTDNSITSKSIPAATNSSSNGINKKQS